MKDINELRAAIVELKERRDVVQALRRQVANRETPAGDLSTAEYALHVAREKVNRLFNSDLAGEPLDAA